MGIRLQEAKTFGCDRPKDLDALRCSPSRPKLHEDLVRKGSFPPKPSDLATRRFCPVAPASRGRIPTSISLPAGKTFGSGDPEVLPRRRSRPSADPHQGCLRCRAPGARAPLRHLRKMAGRALHDPTTFSNVSPIHTRRAYRAGNRFWSGRKWLLPTDPVTVIDRTFVQSEPSFDETPFHQILKREFRERAVRARAIYNTSIFHCLKIWCPRKSLKEGPRARL